MYFSIHSVQRTNIVAIFRSGHAHTIGTKTRTAAARRPRSTRRARPACPRPRPDVHDPRRAAPPFINQHSGHPHSVTRFSAGTGADGRSALRVSCDGESVSIWDTRVQDGEPLIFSRAEWTAFVEGIRRGEFDLVEEMEPDSDISSLDDDEP
jgi:hypothetical protein